MGRPLTALYGEARQRVKDKGPFTGKAPKWGDCGYPQDRPEGARFPVSLEENSYSGNDPLFFQILGSLWEGPCPS